MSSAKDLAQPTRSILDKVCALLKNSLYRGRPLCVDGSSTVTKRKIYTEVRCQCFSRPYSKEVLTCLRAARTSRNSNRPGVVGTLRGQNDHDLYPMRSTVVRRVFAVRLTGCEPINKGCYADPRKNPSYMADRAQLIEMPTIMSAFSENTMACYSDRSWKIRLLCGSA